MLDTEAAMDILSAGVSGDAWYGSSTADALSGLDAACASRHVDGFAHSIWEILLHATAWIEEVALRLDGRAPLPPRDGDWPMPVETNEAAWTAAQRRYQEAAADLCNRMAAFDTARWPVMVGNARDQSLGSGVTHATMVVGVIQHNAYHTGQMALLRKALGAPRGQNPER